MTALFSFLKNFESHQTSYVEKTKNRMRRIYKLLLVIPHLIICDYAPYSDINALGLVFAGVLFENGHQSRFHPD